MTKAPHAPYQKVKESRKTLIINNFLGGIAWGVGSTIGLAIIVAILGFVAKQVNVIPFVGNFVSDITKYVSTHR